MVAVGSSLHMDALSTAIACDGCGLPASAGHIAARLERLELVTRFRPLHINVLFVAPEPMACPEDDFYRPPRSREFFNSFLAALDISADAGGCGLQVEPAKMKLRLETSGAEPDVAKLLEFQRRGYYLTYLSECPVTLQYPVGPSADEDAVLECISRLAPTLIKRIRFNYKPKHVVLLETSMRPLIAIFEQVGIGQLLLLDHGKPLTLPEVGDTLSLSRFRKALVIEIPWAATSSGV
jgi:hypothetical protein